MKSTVYLSILLIALCALTIAQEKKEPEYIKNAYNQNPTKLLIQVPGAQLASITEYGFSFWIQWNYFVPKLVHPGYHRGQWLGVGGITENGGNSFCPAGWGDRALGTWLWPGVDGRKVRPAFHMPTYDYNVGDGNRWSEDIDFPEDDFDHKWIFVYQGYSGPKLESFRLVQTASGFVGTGRYTNIKHNIPPNGNLAFRLGACQNDQPNWNGVYYNVNFFYGAAGSSGYMGDQQSVVSYLKNNFKPKEPIQATKTNDLFQGEVSRTRAENPLAKEFNDIEGTPEYGWWGWLRWDDLPDRTTWHLIMRLTQNDPESGGNAENPGDRTLTTWVGPGYIHFTTYHQTYKGGDNWNVIQNINYEDQLESWFFIYYAYSRTERRAFAYIKWFNEKENTLRFENLNHCVTQRFFAYFGKDKWHDGFHGDAKGWKISFGKGTYRESNFKELYEIDESKIIPPVLKEPEDPKPELIETKVEGPMVSTFEVPRDDLGKIKEYSFSMWIRFSYTYPKMMDLGHIRGNWLGIAGVTEKQNTCGGSFGERTLGLWTVPFSWGNPAFHFTTYNQRINNGNEWKNMVAKDVDDFEGNWNFVYFGYSLEQQKTFAYIYFTRSKNTQTLEWKQVVHYSPPLGLKFNLGRCWEPHPQFQGHYYNVRFYYQDRNFLGSQEEVEKYMTTVTKPDQFLPIQEVQVNKEFDAAFDRVWKDEPKNIDVAVAGAEEYAVWGWAQWASTPEKQAWHNLFRISDHKEPVGDNMSKLGDRGLCVWVGDGFIHFTAYTFGFMAGDNVNQWKNVNYEDDLESWFFIYYGYSHINKKAIAYIKFTDHEHLVEFDSTRHFVPFNLKFYLGRDPWHAGFNGKLKGWNFSYGKGAYMASGFGKLIQLAGEEKDNADDVSKEWLQEGKLTEVPWDDRNYASRTQDIKLEEVKDLTEYSFSLWHRFSYNDPKKVSINQIRGEWHGIAGLTEKLDYCDWTQHKSRTLAVFYRPYSASPVPAYHFTTYATNKNNANFWQNMEFPREAHDSEWNWIYFGYSLTRQEAFAYVYFSKTKQVQTLSWTNIAHTNPPKSLKFIYGSCGQQYKSLNGLFFDVRMRVDQFAYKNDQESLAKYFKGSVYDPKVFKPIYSEIKLTNCIANQKVEDKDPIAFQQFPDQFRGAAEYAVYGWSRWLPTNKKQAWHTLFRVTINNQNELQDVAKFGDRTLTCFVGNGILAFATYLHEMQAGGDVNNYQTIEYKDNLEKWFWVYMGYSYEQKKVFVYVKFATEEKTLIFSNVWHEVPRYMGVYLGKDPYYGAFNGELKGWFFTVGKGSYKTLGEFEPLFNANIPKCGEKGDTGDKLIELRKTPKEGEEYAKQIIVPKEEAEAVKEHGFWMWLRFQYTFPEKIRILQEYKQNCYSVARVTEGKNNVKDLGDRNLALFICSNKVNPVFYFSTYDKQKDVKDIHQISVIDLDNFDGVWNWVYFAYSSEKKIANAYVKYGKSQKAQFLQFADIEHNHPYAILKFLLGKQFHYNGFNGLVHDVQFSTVEGTFKETENDIAQLLTKDIQAPPVLQSKTTRTKPKIMSVRNKELQIEAKDKTPKSKVWDDDFDYVEEYAVIGKFKWQAPASRKGTHFLFRLTTNEEEYNNDKHYYGDRTLACFLKKNKLSFVTYRFDAIPEINFVTDIKVDEKQLEDWFTVYFGYNRDTREAFVYIKFADGKELTKVIKNIRHVNPTFFQMYIGTDRFYRSGRAWNGSLKEVFAIFGKGAFTNDAAKIAEFAKFQPAEDSGDDKFDTTKEPGKDNEAEYDDFDDDDDNQGEKKDTKDQPKIKKQGEPKYIDDKQLEGINPIDAPEQPNGECAILYEECEYKGQSFNLCKDHEDLDLPHDIKSIYVPKKTKVTLYNLDKFKGKKATFTKSVECLDSIDFNILLTQQNQITQTKKYATLIKSDVNIRKKKKE